jgi:hypothetical protein
MHRGGYAFVYREIRKDGIFERTVVMSVRRSVPQKNENRCPVFAGSFWNEEQLEYIEGHRSRFRPAAPRTVAGIDCEMCELDVPAKEIARVVQLSHPLLKSGGTLQVCVARRLGFGLPLVEVRAPDGTTVVTYESTNWRGLPGGISFPQRIRKEIRTLGGPTVYEQFDIVPELINQQIGEAEFEVEIPVGTHVRDERDPAHTTRFDLVTPSTSLELLEGQRSTSAGTSDSAVNRFWIVAAILLIVAMCSLLALRYRRRRE